MRLCSDTGLLRRQRLWAGGEAAGVLIVGILLAAGSATRFGSDKLMHPLAEGTPIAVRSLDQVFAHLVNPDVTGPDAARFAALKRTLQQRLTYVQVFAVGAVQVQLYFVGHDRCGALVGLHTVSIET